jgi:hypothetical protein
MRRWRIAAGLVLVLAAAGLGAAWWLGAFRGPESFRFVLADAGDAAAVKARLQGEPGVQQVVAGLPVRSMGDIARSP